MKRYFCCSVLLLLFFAKAGTAFDYSLVLQRNIAAEAVGSTTASEVEPTIHVTPNPVGLKQFVPNLGRNFVSVFSKQNIPPTLAGSLLTIGAHGFDDSVAKYFEGHQTLSAGDRIGDFLGGPEFMIPAVTTLLFVGHHYPETSKFRAMTYSLAQGYVLTMGMTYAIKYSVGRERPDGSNNQSFVSGHASSAFLWASVLGHYYGKKVYIPAYGIAIFIATSRLSDNVHWLSDVVGGATLGFVVGSTVSRRIDSLVRPGHFAFAPMVDPHGHGTGLSMTYDF